MEEPFRLERFVIHRATDAIEQVGWYLHIKSAWHEIMTPNSKMLVLGGIHGSPTGEIYLGQELEQIPELWQMVIDFCMGEPITNPEFLNCWHEVTGDTEFPYLDDIRTNNIRIVFVDVTQFMNGSRITNLDQERLKQAFREHDPTIVSLAWCDSIQSKLNNMLRAAEIGRAHV